MDGLTLQLISTHDMLNADDRDTGLDYLLGLHGAIHVQTEAGHWIKYDVVRVPLSETRPHGIKYSLTLHSPGGARLVGFDNAHAVAPNSSQFKHAGKKHPYDHQHRHATDKGTHYGFNTAYQLLEDFFKEVDRILKGEV